MEEGNGPLPSEPPPLPYSLRTRKKAIAIFWTIFVIDTLGQPLILYWTLWYLTDLSHNLVFSIVTACLGGVSVFEYFYRLYNLFRKGSRARPLNAKKSRLDFFHWNFTIVWLFLAVELIVGSVPAEPFVRLIAMVLPTVMFYFGIVHLSLDILRMAGFKAPFRISSTPKGSAMPTALYALIEDVVAVDGGGGQIYRYALRTRYLSSPYFRRMLFEMNCFWSGGSIIFAAAITAVIFTVSEPVAFTLGWTLPFAWAGVWTLITIPWVQSDLRREKKAWAENRGQGGILWVDDIAAPTARTRFASVQDRFTPWTRDKQSAPSTPSADGVDGLSHSPGVTANVTDSVSHDLENMPDSVDSMHEEKKVGDLEAK
ncbi:hypothetical protein N7448_003507 [Penicillium atrosanguineum]|uniref:Uncharacterized protein n=1 Tax=Penicillium atrosanguineum TaxID=1132637 RepID=A0A9W9PZ71_9EURO|nr:uncharacterized protein N7443_002476 [Penicillium atrosanguineum]KAJ5122373.1 hypothetical protein N7526_009310 [Penicillium atrosanguineum]KAJ5140099.1 hypothetical protein N7448_003507 [Penicillium atrosanguineum]KAJ5310015.1 hypothetical protein N7443_002476 [Penicillium atrosanguineum]KAJ5315533.1 hypothetical protein N7476_005840 [Penicillium atrosanguineum]